MISRRSILSLFAAAPAAIVASKLPAVPQVVMRTNIPVGELYGVGPMMTATEVVRRHNEAIAQMIKTMGDKDPFDFIDWDVVHKELGAYGIAVTKTEIVDGS